MQIKASVSTGLSVVLSTIKSYPKISRKQLAEKALAKLIGEKSTDESSQEYQHAKTTLATDLIWLAKAGHVIEFADGTLDLPLPPRPVEAAKGGAALRLSRISKVRRVDGSADEESSTASIGNERNTRESKPELAADAQEGHASESAPEEPDASPESSVEPAATETATEPSLQLPADAPELLATEQESLERVASHST